MDFTFSHPTKADGHAIYDLASRSQPLDLNSCYHYVLFAHHFAQTSLVAKAGGKLAAFVTGYREPDAPETLFVWQVAVDSDFRGHGLAKRLLLELIERTDPETIEATITPDNEASQGLFRALAKALDAPWSFENDLFSSADLGGGHEPERTFLITRRSA
jgi:diaminobutyrate acetyltransferase